MADRTIITELLEIESWAEALANKCRKARRKIQGEVSTSPTNPIEPLSDAAVKKLMLRSGKRFLKSKTA